MLPPKGYQALRKGRVSRSGNWYFITKLATQRLSREASPEEQMRLGRLVQPGVPEIILDSLGWLQDRELIKLMAYCLMPDHLHLLFQLGENASLDNVMKRFGSFTGLKAYRHTGQGQLWAVGYHDHALRKETEINLIIEYTENNPVKAGLVLNARDWPWSSVHWQE